MKALKLNNAMSEWNVSPAHLLTGNFETREYESVLDRARAELLKLISVRKPADQPLRRP
jgi:hypothetical protein